MNYNNNNNYYNNNNKNNNYNNHMINCDFKRIPGSFVVITQFSNITVRKLLEYYLVTINI